MSRVVIDYCLVKQDRAHLVKLLFATYATGQAIFAMKTNILHLLSVSIISFSGAAILIILIIIILIIPLQIIIVVIYCRLATFALHADVETGIGTGVWGGWVGDK